MRGLTETEMPAGRIPPQAAAVITEQTAIRDVELDLAFEDEDGNTICSANAVTAAG